MPQIGSATIGQVANSSEIVKHLFLAELVRLDGVLNGIIDKNDRINGVDVSAGFLHQGEFYQRSNATRPPTYGERLTLNPELWPTMDKYLKAVTICSRQLRRALLMEMVVSPFGPLYPSFTH